LVRLALNFVPWCLDFIHGQIFRERNTAYVLEKVADGMWRASSCGGSMVGKKNAGLT
jgi:hypothetical protein